MKTLLVLKYELLKILRSRSFILVLLLVPAVSFTVLIVTSNIQKRNQASANLTEIVAGQMNLEIQGFIDQSGLITMIPNEVKGELIQFADISSASEALKTGEVSSFYVIPDDYLSTGQIDAYRLDFNPFGGMEAAGNLTFLLRANFLQDDPAVLARITNPLNLTTEYKSDQPQRDPSSNLTFFLPYGVTFLLYILILGASSLLLSSVSAEKQNRVLEILLTTINPIQLLTGKIIALGLIGLLQTVVWSVAGLLLLRYSGQAFALPEAFQLPTSILVWAVVFFILGYAIYASLMAGIGALVPNIRESSQATVIVILPMIIPLMLISSAIQNPNAPLFVGLSLFPLTASVAMMTRLAATQVPVWQPILAALLEAIVAVLIIRSAAGIFRAQNLLAGKEFNVRVYFRALFGKT